MNEQDIQVNRQLYLLEQKVELMKEILRDFRDALDYLEPTDSDASIRVILRKSINNSLNKLEVIPDA